MLESLSLGKCGDFLKKYVCHRSGVLRFLFLCLALSAQLFLVLYSMLFFSEHFLWLRLLLHGISYGVVLWLVSSSVEPAFKISWLLVLLPFPLLGGCLFLLLQGQGMGSHLALEKMRATLQRECSSLPLSQREDVSFLPYGAEAAPQLYYLQEVADCRAYTGSQCRYFSSGEAALPEILRALQGAKSYVFLEFFLVREGLFWDSILEILQKKVAEGVEVRLIYDGAGCFFSLPRDYPQRLAALGIACQVFHPVYPLLSTRMNHRDHRKMLIVDGTWAMTGGINLSDEYINAWERFGVWKDSVLCLQGEAVWSMTVMFLSMWDYCGGGTEKYLRFFPKKLPFFQETSVILPYTNCICQDATVGQAVLLNLIARARHFIHITSPYLILDTASQTALCQAAKSGIEVVIITPGIPDKKLVFQVTRAFYPLLLEAGVEIYQYSSGFVHGKTVVVDGIFATVGTVNLDFRSLFLHFENGVWLWGADCIQEIEADFQRTLAFSESQSYKASWRAVLSSVLRIFSPLM